MEGILTIRLTSKLLVKYGIFPFRTILTIHMLSNKIIKIPPLSEIKPFVYA